jgi:hypothetical protein
MIRRLLFLHHRILLPQTLSAVLPVCNFSTSWKDFDSHHVGELRHRAVRIYQPTRNTMQSGGAKGNKWRIDWDILQGGGRWENPLMGWASSYVSMIFAFYPLLADGFDVQCRLHARNKDVLPLERGRHSLRRETRWVAYIVFLNGTMYS